MRLHRPATCCCCCLLLPTHIILDPTRAAAMQPVGSLTKISWFIIPLLAVFCLLPVHACECQPACWLAATPSLPFCACSTVAMRVQPDRIQLECTMQLRHSSRTFIRAGVQSCDLPLVYRAGPRFDKASCQQDGTTTSLWKAAAAAVVGDGSWSCTSFSVQQSGSFTLQIQQSVTQRLGLEV